MGAALAVWAKSVAKNKIELDVPQKKRFLILFFTLKKRSAERKGQSARAGKFIDYLYSRLSEPKFSPLTGAHFQRRRRNYYEAEEPSKKKKKNAPTNDRLNSTQPIRFGAGSFWATASATGPLSMITRNKAKKNESKNKKGRKTVFSGGGGGGGV